MATARDALGMGGVLAGLGLGHGDNQSSLPQSAGSSRSLGGLGRSQQRAVSPTDSPGGKPARMALTLEGNVDQCWEAVRLGVQRSWAWLGRCVLWRAREQYRQAGDATGPW